MSCGDPHETDCSEVLDHLYEFLDREMPDGDCAKFEVHIDECSPCLEKYGLEQAVKKLVKRCCGHDDVPVDLRSKVMGRIELIRAGEAVPEQTVMEQAVADSERAAGASGAPEPGPASGTTGRGGSVGPGDPAGSDGPGPSGADAPSASARADSA